MRSVERDASMIATWAGAILRTLEARGIDARPLAVQAGLDPAALFDAEARVSRLAVNRFWPLAVEASGDPAIGLIVPRYMMQTTFHALGYAVLASSTFKEALERMVRFRRLVGDVIQFALHELGDRYRFEIDVSAPPGAPPQAVDAATSIIVRQARLLKGDRNFSPLAVLFKCPQPANLEPYLRLFRTKVAFAQRCNAVEYARADVEARLPAGNAELARQNEQMIVNYLARLEQASLSSRVEAALLQALPDGAPSKQAIARTLAMSPRNLQRHLAEEGTSFKELLNQARVTLARNYVREGRLSVTEIAFLLGFADTSTFSRAFKRWTGLSPREYSADTRGSHGRHEMHGG